MSLPKRLFYGLKFVPGPVWADNARLFRIFFVISTLTDSGCVDLSASS